MESRTIHEFLGKGEDFRKSTEIRFERKGEANLETR